MHKLGPYQHAVNGRRREGQQPRHHRRADRRMALAGALLGRSDRHEHLRGERQTNLREVHSFFSISLRRAAARGRITTTTKTNGSISSKAGIVFYGNWTDMLPGDCVYAPWLGPAFKIIQISLSVCSSISPLRDLNDSSPRQPRRGRNQSPT